MTDAAHGTTTGSATAVDDLFSGFEHELIGESADRDGAKQVRLLEAIRTFFESDSMQEAADRLFVHRNTVFKRLQTSHALSGLDVTRHRRTGPHLRTLTEGTGPAARTISLNPTGRARVEHRHSLKSPEC